MTLFQMLCEDLKREIGQYLHKKYYEVVIEELILMTEPVATILNEWDNEFISHNKVIADKIYVDMESGCKWYTRDRPPYVPLARWIVLRRRNESFNGFTIQEMKNEVKRMLIK